MKVRDSTSDKADLLTGLTVLHYDGDFDTIQGITGQAMRWVVDPGTADR